MIKGGLPVVPLLILVPHQEPVVWAPDGSVSTLRPIQETQDVQVHDYYGAQHHDRFLVVAPHELGQRVQGDRGVSQLASSADASRLLVGSVHVPSMAGREADK